MIHARKDYQNRWSQDPALQNPTLLSPGSTPIAEDEPVFLLRAQDVNFVPMLMHYIEEVCKNPDYNIPIPLCVYQHIELARKWQEAHGAKHPDIPPLAKKPTHSSSPEKPEKIDP